MAVSNHRNRIVDALKCLAIALVVLTHLLNLRAEFQRVAPWLVGIIVAFNMPLFAFLSGYVLHGREGVDPVVFLSRKAKSLLVPYFAWITLELPLRHVPVDEWGLRLESALFDPRAGMQMWFLWVLFAIFVIFAGVRALGHSSVWFAVVAGALATCAVIGVPETFGMDKVVFLAPFFLLGYLASRHREAIRRYDDTVFTLGLLAAPPLLFLHPEGGVWKLVIALAGIAMCWAVYRFMPQWSLVPQSWIGGRSLGIYGLQMVLLPLLVIGHGVVGVAISWVSIMAAALFTTVLIERSPTARGVLLGSWPRKARRLTA